jgi:hypothetical protein
MGLYDMQSPYLLLFLFLLRLLLLEKEFILIRIS